MQSVITIFAYLVIKQPRQDKSECDTPFSALHSFFGFTKTFSHKNAIFVIIQTTINSHGPLFLFTLLFGLFSTAEAAFSLGKGGCHKWRSFFFSFRPLSGFLCPILVAFWPNSANLDTFFQLCCCCFLDPIKSAIKRDGNNISQGQKTRPFNILITPHLYLVLYTTMIKTNLKIVLSIIKVTKLTCNLFAKFLIYYRYTILPARHYLRFFAIFDFFLQYLYYLPYYR